MKKHDTKPTRFFPHLHILPQTFTTSQEGSRGMYQDLILTLEDGRKITACVEAFCGFDLNEPMELPAIVLVELSRPSLIPQELITIFNPPSEGELS